MVGLTGGIATGKSTVAAMFMQLGIPIVNADELAREVVQPGTMGLKKIVAKFGDAILLKDGTLDRKKLSTIVFENAEARSKLNAITHPLIAKAGAQRMTSLQNSPAPYILYEAALIVENQSYKLFAALIVVHVQPNIQLTRLLKRDDISERQARARINAQLPLEDKVAVADYVVHNDADLHSTQSQAQNIHNTLVCRFTQEATP